MKVLVTGHKGFIGGEFYRHIKEYFRNDTVVFEGDLLKMDFRSKYDIIYHFAAKNRKETDFSNELELTKKLVSLLNHGGEFRYASSFMVYADNQIAHEASKIDPRNEYARSKLECEKYIIENVKKYFIFRIGHVYGKNAVRGFIKTLFDARSNGKTIEIFDGGTVMMNFIHVDDVISMMRTAFVPGIYNVGNENILLNTLAQYASVKHTIS